MEIFLVFIHIKTGTKCDKCDGIKVLWKIPLFLFCFIPSCMYSMRTYKWTEEHPGRPKAAKNVWDNMVVEFDLKKKKHQPKPSSPQPSISPRKMTFAYILN